jgi:hypothetical protein
LRSAVVLTRAVESVHKISDSDSFIKAQYVVYDNGKPTKVKKGIKTFQHHHVNHQATF